MKRKILIKGIIIVLLVSFVGCEKVHRSRYTGKWDFMVIEGGGPYGQWKADTTYYAGKISIAAIYNKIKIKYLKDSTLTIGINECGELYNEYEDPHDYAYGAFSGENKVFVRFGYAALGGGYGYTIYGNRKGRR